MYIWNSYKSINYRYEITMIVSGYIHEDSLVN